MRWITALFRSEDYRARLVRNLSANVLGQAINTVIQLLGIPILLHFWGKQLYGEWLLLSTIPAYFVMNEAGFGSVGGSEMTVLFARGDRDGALRVFQSIWLLISVVSLILLGTASLAVWITPIDRWLGITALDRTATALTTVFLLLHFGASQQTGLFSAGFRCTGKYALGTTWTNISRTGEFALMATVAVCGGGPVLAAGSLFFGRVVGSVLMLLHLHRVSPWLTVGWRQARWSEIRRLAGPAFSFMAFPLGHALRYQGMVTTVGIFLGPTAVVIFSTARTLTNLIFQVMNIINHAVWPELSAAFGANDLLRARDIHRHACRASLWISSAAVIGLVFFGASIYRVWTHGEVILDLPLFYVLLFAQIASSLWLPSSIVPLAINQHQRTALSYLLGTVITLVLAVFLLPRMGLVGAGVALLSIDVMMVWHVLPNSLALLQERFFDFALVVLRPPLAFRAAINPEAHCALVEVESGTAERVE